MRNLTLSTIFILLLILSAAFENRVSAQVTYTWNGLTNTNYQNPVNWTPARATPATNDILVYNGVTNPAPTVTNIPTQSIGQLQFINNVNATFDDGANASGVSTLTVGGGSIAGNDFTIMSGSSLTMTGGAGVLTANSIRIAGSNTSTGNVAGTLTLSPMGSTNNGLTLSSNFIVTVTNTVNDAGTFAGASETTLIFTGTAVYNKTNQTNVGNFPNDALWQDGSQTNIIGFTSASGQLPNFGNGNHSFSNLTWNSPGQTGTISLGPSANFSVRDTFTIASTGTTGTGSISLSGSTPATESDAVIIIVNYTQTSGTLNLNASSNAASSATFFQSGVFNQTGGSITVTSTVATANLIEFRGTTNQPVNMSGTNPGFINYRVLNAMGITLTGTITLNSSASSPGPSLRISSTASPAVAGAGTVVYGTNTVLIYDAGTFDSASGNQTAGVNEFPPAAGPPNLTINNISAAPNNIVTIPFDRTIPGMITLTNGIVSTGANTLTSDTTGTVTRTNGFVEGNFRKLFAAGGGQSFEFPVGTVSGTDDGYTPVNLTNLTAAAGGGLTVKAFDTGSPAITTAKITRYWELTETGSIEANLQFIYLFADQSTIPDAQLDDLRVFRNNVNECLTNTMCVTPATASSNGVGTVTGKTDFSPWGIGVDATTAASVDIGGRVRQANGRGVFRARVTLIDAEGVQRVAYTNPFGYYRFTEVVVGETYVITASHLRYQIAQPTQVHFVEAENVNINFTAFIADDAEKPVAPQKRNGKRAVEQKRP